MKKIPKHVDRMLKSCRVVVTAEDVNVMPLQFK